MQVAPTLLNYSVNECVDQFNNLSPYFNTFQIDIQDGKFIANKTINLMEYFAAFKKSNQKLVSLSTFDFHFQTLTFEQDIAILASLKKNYQIGTLLIHFSLNPDINNLKKQYPFFSFGIVINPEESIEQIASKYRLEDFPGVQIMSIHPGPQGSAFIPETLNKIDQLRLQNYRNKIYLDGAINQKTLPIILGKKNRADVLCIGSFLTKAADLQANLNHLKSLNLT